MYNGPALLYTRALYAARRRRTPEKRWDGKGAVRLLNAHPDALSVTRARCVSHFHQTATQLIVPRPRRQREPRQGCRSFSTVKSGAGCASARAGARAARGESGSDRGRAGRGRGAERGRRLLLRGERRDHRPTRVGRAYRDRPLQALGAAAGGAKRTGREERDGQAADGAQAANQEGPPSTVAARRSSSRSSARSTPSKTAGGCGYAANRPPATNGASSARSTTCSSSTAPADST